jgi:hypothetical protein
VPLWLVVLEPDYPTRKGMEMQSMPDAGTAVDDIFEPPGYSLGVANSVIVEILENLVEKFRDSEDF